MSIFIFENQERFALLLLTLIYFFSTPPTTVVYSACYKFWWGAIRAIVNLSEHVNDLLWRNMVFPGFRILLMPVLYAISTVVVRIMYTDTPSKSIILLNSAPLGPKRKNPMGPITFWSPFGGWD